MKGKKKKKKKKKAGSVLHHIRSAFLTMFTILLTMLLIMDIPLSPQQWYSDHLYQSIIYTTSASTLSLHHSIQLLYSSSRVDF